MQSAIYLVDASAFIHRAFHAIRHLTTKDGRPTGAAYGFTAMLLKLLREKKPEYVGVVFDSRGPGRRHQLFPAYKANRPPMDPALAAQQESLRAVTRALGFFSLEQPGFEADDLIAAAAVRFAALGRPVVIVSGDKDFYQLLSDRISMYDPDPKKGSAHDTASFTERFGLPPAAFLEMQALMGDPGDNIPGVPKVGEKTAQKLIAQFGSLDHLYARLDEVEPEKLRDNLAAHREQAYLSRRLALLGEEAAPDFILDDLAVRPPDQAELTRLFQELEFSRLLTELPGAAAVRPRPALAAGAPQPENGGPDHRETVSYADYAMVNGPEAWPELLRELRAAERLAVDLETDSASPSRARIVGVSLCARPGRSFYVPINHQTLGAPNQPWEKFIELAGPFLTGEKPLKIGQNAKFDWLILRRHGLTLPPPADDPMLASYLVDPESRHGLDALSLRYLGHQAIPFKSLVPDPRKSHFGDLTPEEALDYAAEDADLTWRLAGRLRRKLEAEETPDLLRLYEEVELPLEDLLARMEGHGVLIDPGRLAEISADLGSRLRETEAKIFALAGHTFNIGSPKQLSEVLFNELGLPAGKKTAKKTGFSTDDEVLADLAPLHPLAFEVRAWRGLDKLKSTYADKLPKTVNPETGRVHTSYNQTLTATGRLSSSEPNLQNIPVKTDEGRRIRSAFVAPPGAVLISADYSQIELRVLAHFSQDAALLRAFENDEDIHTQTAAEVFGLAPSQVSPAQRREAKTINFGVVYGQGPFGLAKQLGVPQAVARDFIERYFTRFPGVRRYMEETRQAAGRTGRVATWFGRCRHLPALTQGGYQARQEAERMAINTPIQGTAADLIKMAMLAVQRRLDREHPAARLILQVHDELVVEAPAGEAPAITALLRREMENAAAEPPLSGARPLSVPLRVDLVQGYSWAKE